MENYKLIVLRHDGTKRDFTYTNFTAAKAAMEAAKRWESAKHIWLYKLDCIVDWRAGDLISA